MRLAPASLLVLLLGCSTSEGDEDVCKPDDADGIVNVDVTVPITVDDTSFRPAIVKTQNASRVTLILTNAGTRPHGFALDCLPTPNDDGCPARSCFPAEATIAPIAPGTSATVVLSTPLVEGIYAYRSPAEGDVATGQFILQ
jgi:hypothetical protein